MMKAVCATLSLFVFLALSIARAESGSAGADDFGFFLGEMLPNQLEGVEDILPIFGGRYAFGMNFGAIELGLQNSHAMGVDFTTVTATVRGDFPLATGLSTLLYLGPTMNWYSKKNASDREIVYGIEVGGAARLAVTDALSLRADLKFMGGPGTSLYLLGGVEFR